jgi:hypothetical protein
MEVTARYLEMLPAGASRAGLVVVLFAKETKASSLRHDRVVRGAHD